MTKAEFIKRLEDQFRGIIEGEKSRTAAEIEGHRARMDAQTFADWLRSEIDKANAKPALKVFDRVLRPSHSTPHEAADSLAGLIEMDACPFINEAGKMDFDPTRVNWQTQWDSAAPLTFSFSPEKSDGWKYRRAFADYMAAVKAETRAGVFAAHIGQAWPQGSVLYQIGKGETEALDFRADVIKRGSAYFLLWDEYKETQRDTNLPEKSFLLCDIDHCEEEIERWKNRTHSFRNSWMGMLKANIRAHRERLEALEKDAATTGKPKAQTASVKHEYDFEALFVESAKDRFLRAATKAGMIDSAGKWLLGNRKKWVIPAAWNLVFNSDLAAPGLDNFGACKAIAKHWGITISQTTFDDYWSNRREDHSPKRGFDKYSLFLQEITRG